MSSTFFNKLKWILGIMLVFGLIAATNLIDRSNFTQISNSVISIYEDRLVAKDIVLDIQQLLYEKELALKTDDADFFEVRNIAVNHELEQLVIRFDKTELTEGEERVFADLKSNVNQLVELEKQLNQNEAVVLQRIEQIKFNLEDLAKIQIVEGRRQVSIAKRAKASIDMFTQLEIYMLIILAVMIQIIVLYKPRADRS